MASFECAAECGNRNEISGECMWAKSGRGLCNYGRFATICHEHIKADYKIREFSDLAIKATIQGKSGIVEVWGGQSHANEVWVIERGTKKETRITGKWWIRPLKGVLLDYAPADHMSLDEALERAFSLAGVQTRLGI